MDARLVLHPPIGVFMRKIALVTDSAAAIPETIGRRLQERGGFVVVPLVVEIDNNPSHASNDSQLHDSIALAHALGQKIHTASPAVNVFERTYRDLLKQGYEAVLSVHLSAELSSTYNIARLAAQNFDGKVFVIDSRTVAMAMGWAVLKAYELATSEEDPMQLAEATLEMCENTQLFFYIPTLEALKRGGRVHPALARVGQLMQIRPVVTIEDGKLVYLDRPRTKEGAQESLATRANDEMRRRTSGEFLAEHKLTPTASGTLKAAHYCGNRPELIHFLAKHNQKTDIISPLPAALSAHTGLGALALVIY